MLYVPILKYKQGEKDALLTLRDEDKDKIIPLLEVTPDVITKGNFCGVSDFWNDRKYILDVSPEFRDEMQGDEYLQLFERCKNEKVVPVVRLSDNEDTVKHLSEGSTNGIALRLYVEEILDDDFEGIFDEFTSNIDISKTDLIIDAQSIESNKINETTFLLKGSINLISDIQSYRSVIFTSNSFPRSLEVERYKLTTIPRIESVLFEKVSGHFRKNGVELVYSDYSINHWSYFEFIVGIQPSFNIRYTTPDHYVIYKGDTNKKGGLKIEKVSEGCRLLVESAHYFGEDFSWGDNEINEKATGESTKSGNLTTWRAIGTNHHITFIVDLLSTQS